MEQTTGERVSARPPPKIQIRRYGRTDYEKFDELALGSHLCVGSTNIGKVEIDCKYHWRKAEWGVLGVSETPAGILYMDITFRQPAGYWLQTGSVFITMSEDQSSYALKKPTKRQLALGSWSPSRAHHAVQMTEHFGPRTLVGTPCIESHTKSTKATPSIGITGVEMGGIGFESSTSKEKTGQWVFQGSLRKPHDGNGYRTLQWDLSPNERNPKQLSCQEFSTAFAFEHRKRPVYMRVEIEGKLGSKCRQMRQAFSTKLGKQDKSTLTRMDLRDASAFTKSLDETAKQLDPLMELENFRRTPIELPDSIPALVGSEEPLALLSSRNRGLTKEVSFDAKDREEEDSLTLALRRCLEHGLGSDSFSEEVGHDATKAAESGGSESIESQTDKSRKEMSNLHSEDPLKVVHGERFCQLLARAIVFLMSFIFMVRNFFSQMPVQAALIWRLVNEQPWVEGDRAKQRIITQAMKLEDVDQFQTTKTGSRVF